MSGRSWHEGLVETEASGQVRTHNSLRPLFSAPPREPASTDNRQPTTNNRATGNRFTGSRRAIGALLLALLFGACTRAPAPPLPHEAYIWQRLWTPELADAIEHQGAGFAGWRVLLLQVVGERLIDIEPDPAALVASAKPLRWVVRIEGAREPLPAAQLAAHLLPAIERWRAAGLVPLGIEIDHDCATAALADYAAWLQQLRALLPAGLELSITVLPTWMDSPDLARVLAAVDASVLQVHAVEGPDRPLFAADTARAWTRAYAGHGRRFAVALPAYGVRVASTPDGQVRSVDAETDVDSSGASGRELRADPQELRRYLKLIAAEAIPELQGLIWFRLPLPGDRRAWSAATLAAVVAGESGSARYQVQATATPEGSFDLRVVNPGPWDGPAPIIDLPSDCRYADALGGYRLGDDGDHLRFQPAADAWLRSGHGTVVGWTRCNSALTPTWDLP
ncbi:MAG: DUF3142 domain-containing protein [Lysobacterales bacterium]